jgi:tetratricopeptide (TPR) repeat protein
LEHEADACAVESLYRRGYNIREYARALDLLRNGPEVELSKEPFFWASHPKLASRVVFVNERAAELQPSTDSFLLNESTYRVVSMGVLRHNASLAILLGRPRTALSIAQKLVNQQSGDPENYVLLGDAYRSLGARTPVPQPEELTDEAKDVTRKRMKKMTIAEYDAALMNEPQGPSHSQANFDHAIEAFQRALSLDPQHATAYRGLGFLYERESDNRNAIVQFEKYLELAPQAKDARQIRMHLKSLESPAESRNSQVQTAPAH